MKSLKKSSESSRCPWKEKHHNYLIEHCSKFKQICVPIVPEFKQTSITAISKHESKFSLNIHVHMSFVEGSWDIFAESLQLRRGKGRGCATCPAWDKILRWIMMNHGETKNILCRKSRRGLQQASQQTKWNLKQEKGSKMIRAPFDRPPFFVCFPASWDLKLLPEVDSFPIIVHVVEAVRFVDL